MGWFAALLAPAFAQEPEEALPPVTEPQITDQPNHRLYGPTRRLWVVIQTLFADCLDTLDRDYFREWGSTWQEDFEMFCDYSYNTTADDQREIVARLVIAIESR